MSSQLMGLFGQPSASAIGRHNANPIGARTVGGQSSDTSGLLLRSIHTVFAPSTQL